MITIINYGMGNLGSIFNMLKKIGYESRITCDIKEIEKATKILLPGVGAFDNAMQKIDSLNLRQVLNYKVLDEKVPVLGICLGMQLLTKSSEEGILPGLGWIPASTVKFRFNDDRKLKVPHMGWNLVKPNCASQLTENLPPEPRFYFVHSYHVKVENEENSMLKAFYGVEFDAAIHKDNIYGAQFHPEKSHKFGMKFFQNFAEL